MAIAKFIHDGDSIDYTPATDVAAGDVVVQGDLVGIAKRDIPAGALGALAVTGVFDMPKLANAGVTIAAGAKVYWDAGNSVATTDTDEGANKYLGKAVRAAGDADATVRVRLEQMRTAHRFSPVEYRRPPEFWTVQTTFGKTGFEVANESGLTIQAAAGDGALPQFRMVAYTGGTMRIAGFPHPVVVDLEGLAIERQDIPVRLDHNPRQGVGHTQRVAIENGQIIAEGLISRDTSWARDVAKSAVNGFPWQASIGAAVVDAEFVPSGQSVTVNGRTFSGPLHVVRQAILKEISFVDSGADPATSARIAAQHKEQAVMDDTTTVSTTNQNPAQTDAGQTQDATGTTADAQGQPTAQTDSPSQSQTQTAQAPATSDTLNASACADDPVTRLRQQMAAETRRIEAIRRICAGKHPDIEAKAIEEGWDENRTELHVLRASRPQVPAVASRPRNASPQVFEAVALMASGLPNSRIEAMYAEPILEAADKLRGVGIQEFCELACGQQLPRFRRDASGWLQAAFSTASLPGIEPEPGDVIAANGRRYEVVNLGGEGCWRWSDPYRQTYRIHTKDIGFNR